MNREKTLDYLRGFAIFQTILVHILYWFGLFNYSYFSIVKSFLLFEMPIFFFVTGAVNSLTHQYTYKSFCLKRIKSIIVPYYFYSTICVLLSGFYYFFQKKLSLELFTKILLSWIFPINLQISPIPYLNYALWFIPVYIITILIFPLIKSIILKYEEKIIIGLILLFIYTEYIYFLLILKMNLYSLCNILNIVQQVVFYLIFIGLGILYPKLKLRNKKNMIITKSILLFSTLGLLISNFVFSSSIDMQKNKFPPNHMFMFFSFMVLSIFYILKPMLHKIYNKLSKLIPLLDDFILFLSKNSLHVFLYQSFSFLIINIFIEALGLENDLLIFCFSFITAYPLTYLIIKIINVIKDSRHA